MIEKQDVEFKREYNDKVNKTMLAFLNTDGGTLYLGMVDDSSIFRIGSNTVRQQYCHGYPRAYTADD
jgi:predicted HTH transcriptional regulator